MLFSWNVFIIILSCSVQCWSYSFFKNSSQAGYLHRIIRQATTCKPDEKLCQSGECIKKYLFCDGPSDCKDGSDETLSNCANTQCPKFAFQCKYGGCVSGDAKCDKNQDCADNSDETLCDTDETVAVSKCGKREAACNDQTCISIYDFCDGTPHCPDGSDETFLRCNNLTCSKQYFQCTYGACVNGDAPCNGIRECADGSDESQSLCQSTAPEGGVVSGCILPPIPANGRYTVNEKSNFIPGEHVPPIARLDFTCQKGYQLDGIADISCNQNNKWNRPIPVCLRTCKERVNPTLDIKCYRNELPVDCTKPVLHGTHADVSCKQFYHFPPSGIPIPYNHLVCEDGSWDYNLLECIPVCGKKNAKGQTNIIGGDKAKIGEYPWHVGIYVKINVANIVKISQICGGSIIHTKVVISAAHCFESGDPKKYNVAAGKYYRLWNDKRDENSQMRDVSQIYIPEIYKGIQHNYANDIAVIVVDKPFEFNNIVNPVCIDWTGNIDNVLLRANRTGYVAGWGLEKEQGDNSIELKHLQMPFVPYQKCYDDSPQDFRPIVGLPDKLCAGRTDGQNVCEGDSGGGLTFQDGDLFYLMGIVSIGPIGKLSSCDASKYATFTKVSYHKDWAKNITRINYKGRR